MVLAALVGYPMVLILYFCILGTVNKSNEVDCTHKLSSALFLPNEKHLRDYWYL